MESNAVFDYAATAFLRKAATDPRYTGFAVRDDFLNPDIRKGDVVVVDRNQGLVTTGIFAIEVPYGMTVVRMQRSLKGGYFEIRDFPERESIKVEGEPVIIGKVVMVFREVV